MVILAFGAVELGSVISAYLTLTHTSREGANLASRGTKPSDALNAIIAASSNTFASSNQGNWKIIYSKLVQDTTVPCPNPPTTPCTYRIASQEIRGNLNKSSRLSATGSVNEIVEIPGINGVTAGQTFHVIEVFYDYRPYIITFIGQGINTDFYDRTIFTNVSGTV
jgi:hypothetical protein